MAGTCENSSQTLGSKNGPGYCPWMEGREVSLQKAMSELVLM